MVKKNLILSLVLVLSLTLVACSSNEESTAQNNVESKNSTQVDKVQVNTEANSASMDSDGEQQENNIKMREITGLDGEKILLPPASEIKRVVVMYPEIISVLYDVIPDEQLIVGANQYAYSPCNEEILDLMYKNWRNVETSFMPQDSYSANVEELLKLKPDLIIYDKDWQGEGMDKIDVPLINMNANNYSFNSEKMTIDTEKLFREIFDVNGESVIDKQWEEANEVASEIFSNNNVQKSVLFVWGNNDQISVMGKGTYIDMFCDKLNLKNVADELESFPNVNIEQIYSWNPDYIFTVNKDVYDTITNDKDKDWSKLSAFKNNNIYEVPTTLGYWNATNSDSPMMIYFLINKLYPNALSNDELYNILIKYYRDVHNVELDSELVKDIIR